MMKTFSKILMILIVPLVLVCSLFCFFKSNTDTVKASADTETSLVWTSEEYMLQTQMFTKVINNTVATYNGLISYRFTFDLSDSQHGYLTITRGIPVMSSVNYVDFKVPLYTSNLGTDLGLASGGTSPQYILFVCSGGSVMPELSYMPTGFYYEYMGVDDNISTNYLNLPAGTVYTRVRFMINEISLMLYIPLNTSESNLTNSNYLYTLLDQEIYFSGNFESEILISRAYNEGVEKGKKEAEAEVIQGSASWNSGYQRGRYDAFEELEANDNYSFVSLFDAIFGGILILIRSLLGFEILGVNMFGFVTGLLTFAVVIKIIAIIKGL